MNIAGKIVFIVLSFFLSIVSQAQEISYSDNEKDAGGQASVEIIGQIRDYYVIYIKSNNSARLNWYNNDMDKMGITELTFIDKDVVNVNFSIMGDEIHIFYQKRAKKMLYLFATKAYPTDQAFNPTCIDSIETRGVFDNLNYTIAHNIKGQKHLYAIFSGKVLNEEPKIQCGVLDQDYALVQKFVGESIAQERLQIATAQVDVEGAFYITMGEFKLNSDIYESLSILSKSRQQSEANLIPIDLKNYAFSGLQARMDSSEKHIFFGGLFHRNKFQAPEGVVSMVYDVVASKITTQHLVAVKQDPRSSGESFRDLKVRQFYIKKDGGIELVAEQSYEETRNSQRGIGFSPMIGVGPSVNTTTQVYSNNDILIFNIAADGALQWTQTIMKQQESSDDEGIYDSFGFMLHPKGSVYLFNEKGRNPRIINAFLSYKGTLALKELGINKDEYYDKSQWIFRAGKQISKDALIVPVVRKGVLSFVKISF